MSAPAAFAALVARDVGLAYRQGGGGLVSLGFFVMTTALAPLALGADPQTLARVAPGLIWIAAALAALLSTERIYQSDYEQGVLDSLALGPLPPAMMTAAKAAAFWAANCAPVVAAAPIVGVLFALPWATTAWLTCALAVGSFAFSLIGSAAAALVVGVRRGGVLIAVLALPLFTPVLVFGLNASTADAPGGPLAPFLLLGAYTLFALATCPFAAAAGVRLNLE